MWPHIFGPKARRRLLGQSTARSRQQGQNADYRHITKDAGGCQIVPAGVDYRAASKLMEEA